jgi:hypothetical protein
MAELNRKFLVGDLNLSEFMSALIDAGQLYPTSQGKLARSYFQGSGGSGLNWRPRSGKDDYTVEVEVPGVNPEDISVKLEGRQLTVTTPRGNLMVPLGTRIDSSRAKANVKNGMLTVSIPKREAATVEIKVETN